MKLLKPLDSQMDRTSAGFGVIEFLICLPLWVALGAGFFLTAYLCFAKIWMEHWADESLICLHKPVRTHACRRWLKDKLSQGTVWGEVRSLHLRYVGSVRSVRFQYRMGDHIQWTIQKQIRHPRADRSRW